MNRRHFLMTGAAALAAAAFYKSNWYDELKKQYSNVLMIIVDDLNDWIGPMQGHPNTKTPNIDKLASQATVFTNAHAPAPLCGPSRASIMTGLSPATTGIYGHVKDNEIKLERGIYLGPSGYEVGFISQAHTKEILAEAAKGFCEALDEVF